MTPSKWLNDLHSPFGARSTLPCWWGEGTPRCSRAIHARKMEQGARKVWSSQGLMDGCTLWVGSAVPVCFTFT